MPGDGLLHSLVMDWGAVVKPGACDILAEGSPASWGRPRRLCDVKGSDKVQKQFLGQAILTHLGLLSASPSPPQLEKSLGLQVTAQSELTRGPY